MSSQAFDRILIVMFENQYRRYVMANSFFHKLARAGCSMSNYFGVFHPSQPNYLASISGEVCNITNDTPPYPALEQKTLVDLMQPGEGPQVVTWKAYMETYPNEAWNPQWVGGNYSAHEQPFVAYPTTDLATYERKHNAFASYLGVQSVQARWENIVDDVAFWDDVWSNSLPQYSWFTPDCWNDGHYLSNTHVETRPRRLLNSQIAGYLQDIFLGDIATSKVRGGSKFNQETIGFNLDLELVAKDAATAFGESRIPPKTLVVVTFDEADYDADTYDTIYDGPNQIYTVLLGDMIEPGSEISTPYNHYSLLRTIQENFGLGSLGKNDGGSNWFSFLYGEAFSWDGAHEMRAISPQTDSNKIGLVNDGSDAVMVFENENKIMTAVSADAFSACTDTGLPGWGNTLALAGLRESGSLLLVTADASGDLMMSTKTSGSWSPFSRVGQETQGEYAVTSFTDVADGREKVMLAWVGHGGFMETLVWDGEWADEKQGTGQMTDGNMSIGELGASLFLVFKERNSFGLRVMSYNTAPFNVIDAVTFEGDPAPQNDTSIHKWSPIDFAVGRFAKKANALKNEYCTMSQIGMATSHGQIRLVYRDQFDDIPQVHSTVFGLNGILTASDWRTNGYGTIDQAGWTCQEDLEGVMMDQDGAIGLCEYGDNGGFLLVYQKLGSSQLWQLAGKWSGMEKKEARKIYQ